MILGPCSLPVPIGKFQIMTVLAFEPVIAQRINHKTMQTCWKWLQLGRNVHLGCMNKSRVGPNSYFQKKGRIQDGRQENV